MAGNLRLHLAVTPCLLNPMAIHRETLLNLEQTLAGLLEGGIRFLNVASDETLGKLLAESQASAAAQGAAGPLTLLLAELEAAAVALRPVPPPHTPHKSWSGPSPQASGGAARPMAAQSPVGTHQPHPPAAKPPVTQTSAAKPPPAKSPAAGPAPRWMPPPAPGPQPKTAAGTTARQTTPTPLASPPADQKAASPPEGLAGAPRVPKVPPADLVPPSGLSALVPFTPKPLAEITTLESLLVQYRNCDRCPLAAHRTRLVFGTGNPQPSILFVGEGPGQEEDIQGEPFVGRAGVLLTQAILGLGLTRADVYIANVVKCRPPQNRAPEPAEAAACLPILKRQMELLQPRLIITLGNVPLKALNPKAGGITKERGKVFEYGPWPVLPTFHPAYLLRNSHGLEDWWQDLKAGLERAYGRAGGG